MATMRPDAIAISTHSPARPRTFACRMTMSCSSELPRPEPGALTMVVLVADIDDGDHRSAAVRTLVHRIDRDEHRRVADGCSRDAADSTLGVPVMMDVGIIEHDLSPAAQHAVAVGLAFHEAVDQSAIQILGSCTLGQRQARAANGFVDAVDIDGILHDAVPDAITAACAFLVAEQH